MDIQARNDGFPKRRRWLFVAIFALVPNALGFLLMLCQSPFGAAYCFSLPGMLVALPSQSLVVQWLGLPLNVLVDAYVAYSFTALKNTWLMLAILGAYVVISRYIAFCLLIGYMAAHT